jgi:hypothetical protein
MAATEPSSLLPPSLDAAKKSLEENGYMILKDPEVGKAVWEMEQRGFHNLSLLSPYGLEYCKVHVFDNEVSVIGGFTVCLQSSNLMVLSGS